MAIELIADGARATILPDYGGRLHQLTITVDGEDVPVLESPEDPATYATGPFTGGCAPVAPWVNRIRDGRFTFEGATNTLPTADDGHALHGLVANQPWTVVARTTRVVELTCPLGDAWPWGGKAWQRFEITPESLVMKLEVRSDREQFPAACGWLPSFRRSLPGCEDPAITLNAGYRYVLFRLLPTGERVAIDGIVDLSRGEPLGHRKLDDCYSRISGPALIDWGRLALRVSTECPNPHVQVTTGETSFSLAPQTAAPDCFNLEDAGITGVGFALASPGRAVGISSRWSWYRKP